MFFNPRRGPVSAAGRPCDSAPQGATRRHWLRSAGQGWLGLACAPWLAACQPLPAAPLKLGLNSWVGYDPLILARERGLIDASQVQVIELSSSSETLRNFRNRLLDAAALTLDEVLRLADEGFEPRIVAMLSASAGADVVMARPGLRDLRQLRGRSIAVEATTVGALMLQRLLQAAQLQVGDVQVMNVQATQHLGLLSSGRVDAAVSYEPLAGQLRAQGFEAIFDSAQMPCDIVDVLVLGQDALQQRPEQAQALVAGWQRGLKALQQAPEASARLLAPGTDLSPGDYLATFKGLSFFSPAQSLELLSGRPLVLGQSPDRLAQTLLRMGLIHRPPDWGRLLAPEVALQVQQRGAEVPA